MLANGVHGYVQMFRRVHSFAEFAKCRPSWLLDVLMMVVETKCDYFPRRRSATANKASRRGISEQGRMAQSVAREIEQNS